MCGRIVQSEPSRYAERLGALLDPELSWHPSWNIAPMASILGVRAHGDARELSRYSWGLLPGWSKDPRSAARCFNARAETVAVKPTFRAAFRRRRLLVPVDGFYEWERPQGTTAKQPSFFSRADGQPLVLAGLWEWWERDGQQRRTATIITAAAGPDMPIHDRQPVVLEPQSWDLWLDPTLDDPLELQSLLLVGHGVLTHHRVRPDVGSVRNDGPQLIEALA